MKMKLLAYYYKKYLHLIPVIMLAVTFLSNFIKMNDKHYITLCNLLGYSILTNILMWCHFNFTGNYCWFSRNASLGLILINLIDIVGNYINYDYYTKIFNIVVTGVCLLLYIFHKIIQSIQKKWE